MIATKRCTRCDIEYPATSAFFYPVYPKSLGKFRSECKPCSHARKRQYRAANRDNEREYHRRYYETNRDKERNRGSQYRKANREKELARKRKYYEDNWAKEQTRKRRYREANRDKDLAYKQRYREINRESVREYNKRYYTENAEAQRERKRKYYAENPDKVRQSARRWNAKNPEKAALTYQRRRARKQALPNTLTQTEWRRSITHWGGCCAYCGKVTNKLMMEHFIPLTNPACTGTVATNIVPACGSCNISKGKRDVFGWLVWKFGEARAREIQSRIRAYFDTVRAEEGED